MESLYQNIIKLLNEHNIRFREYDHDPILSYNDAEKEQARFGWIGVESKNVFLKGNDKKYYLYVTTQGKRVDILSYRNFNIFAAGEINQPEGLEYPLR